jgi:hypothetical protein
MPKVTIDTDQLQPFVGFVDAPKAMGECRDEADKNLLECLKKHNAIRYIFADGEETCRTSAVLTAFVFKNMLPSGNTVKFDK